MYLHFRLGLLFALVFTASPVVAINTLPGADPVEVITRRVLTPHLAEQDYSQIHAGVVTGLYDSFSQAALAGVLYDTEMGLTDSERDMLAYQVLARANRRSELEDEVGKLTTVLLNRFNSFSEPSLRALVLHVADGLGLAGTGRAVLESAVNLCAILADDDHRRSLQGYEVEAMAVAVLAPRYPSAVLGELLGTISVLSPDRRVVGAARESARAILASGPDQ